VTRRALLVAAAVMMAAGSLVACATALEGRQNFVMPQAVFKVKWQRKLTEDPMLEYKPQEFAAAVSDGRRVFVGSSGGVLWALDAHDGAIQWRKKLSGEITSRARLDREHGILYLGTRGGVLYALDAASGNERWRYEIHGPIEQQPALENGLVFFTSGENRVYAIDAEKGTWKWQYDREAPESFTIRGYAAPLVYKGRVYVGFSDGYLACLSSGTGDVMWARSLAGEATRFIDVDGTPVLAHDTLYAASFAGGVYALDPKDGSVKWHFEVEGAGTVKYAGGRVYFAAAKGGLYCLDGEGRPLWHQSLAEGGELSPPLLLGRYVLVSASAAGTYVADAVSGHLCQFFSPGHGVSAEPTTDGRQVYLLSNTGYFYALGPEQG
jgi:outer membrane protein assembly factor BamB